MTDGRGKNGGKRAGSGRKAKAVEMGLVQLLEECWSEAQRQECVRKLAQDAAAADFSQRHEARKLLLAYTYGKPTEHKEIAGADGGDIVLRVVYEQRSKRTAD